MSEVKLPESWCEQLPSVTRVLAEVGLGPNYDSVPPATLEYARVRGRAVHRAIQYLAGPDIHEASLKDWLQSLHSEVRPGADGYRAFCAGAGYQPVQAEMELIHPSWRFVGHPDAFGWLAGDRVLIEWKYMNAVQLAPATRQLAGYLILVEEVLGYHVDTTLVVQLKHDGSYRIHEVDARSKKQVFLAALVIFQERKA